jgi:hypothetical protein
MKAIADSQRKFSNPRQWREFMATTLESATAPSSTAWSASSVARPPLGARINIARINITTGVRSESPPLEAGRDGQIDR